MIVICVCQESGRFVANDEAVKSIVRRPTITVFFFFIPKNLFVLFVECDLDAERYAVWFDVITRLSIFAVWLDIIIVEESPRLHITIAE